MHPSEVFDKRKTDNISSLLQWALPRKHIIQVIKSSTKLVNLDVLAWWSGMTPTNLYYLTIIGIPPTWTSWNSILTFFGVKRSNNHRELDHLFQTFGQNRPGARGGNFLNPKAPKLGGSISRSPQVWNKPYKKNTGEQSTYRNIPFFRGWLPCCFKMMCLFILCLGRLSNEQRPNAVCVFHRLNVPIPMLCCLFMGCSVPCRKSIYGHLVSFYSRTLSKQK